MEQVIQDQIQTIVDRETWSLEDCKELLALIGNSSDAPDKFRAIVGRLERADDLRGAAALKVGIVRYALARFREANEVLAVATDNKDRHFVQGLCCKYLRQFDQAIEEFQRAGDRGWDATEVQIAVSECQALTGQTGKADKALAKLAAKAGESAEYLYVVGLTCELSGRGEEACEAYDKARGIEAGHPGATFRLAYYHDLHGNDDYAIELYSQCVSRLPSHVGALLNLAVLLEDAGRYDEAAQCLRRLLRSSPTHARARLFLKDVEASKTMYFDEDQARRIAKHNAVLDIPVTDFELSVRARNCLKKMNIRTLGDLVMTTEVELLAYKNFGETSLLEIKEMLTAKGLHLGQGLEDEGMGFSSSTPEEAKAANQGLLATPLDRIELSVRARSAIEGLGVKTLGDLANMSEPELLACKNFGQSSLNEIRLRLSEYGLRLREA